MYEKCLAWHIIGTKGLPAGHVIFSPHDDPGEALVMAACCKGEEEVHSHFLAAEHKAGDRDRT